MHDKERDITELGVTYLYQLSDLGVLGTILKKPVNISTGYLISAVFDIETSDGRRIVKFRNNGYSAEQLAYDKWRQENVPLPKVLSAGNMRDANFGYLVTEPILNQTGNLAPTGIVIPIDKRGEIENFMGTNLAKMHNIKMGYFGGMLDQNVQAHFTSWNEYIKTQLEILNPRLQNEMGLKPAEVEALSRLTNVVYSSEATFSHGDFGVHNVLVRNLDPFIGVILDPNPIATDPYYDVAYYLNLKEAWSKKKIDIINDGFVGAYFKNDFDVINLDRLAALRAFTAIYRVLSTIDRKEYTRTQIYKDILLEQLSLVNF